MRATSAARTLTIDWRQQLAHLVQSMRSSTAAAIRLEGFDALVVRRQIAPELEIPGALGHAQPSDLRQAGDHTAPATRTTTFPIGPSANR